jgi:pyrimidine-nucleoside phosphorylase
MRAIDIIRKKRDGERLEPAEINAFIHGVTSGDWPDYQASALLMAIVLRGMDAEETAALTRAMVESGARLDLSDIPGPKIDKHSTGGVGDKTSLILAPLLASCGIVVPMMSGRGLGHTGGTLDKLESIPGFRVGLSEAEFRTALQRVGCAMIGQTAAIAPADKILYALRDVTATVESIPLITASIMSKKLAEGIHGLVMDVKCGHGAFMKTPSDARALAESLCRTGTANQVRTVACVTAMDAPLGRAVGNALEVIESIETLKGRGPADLEHLCLVLATQMLRLGGFSGADAEAVAKLRAAITSGRAVEKFRAMIAEQAGDPRVVDNYRLLPMAPERTLVRAERSGYVTGVDAELVGRASVVLGAGRNRVEEAVDHAVGASIVARVGDPVKPGDALVEVHYRDADRLAPALELLGRAWAIADVPSAASPLILETISP